MAYRRAQDHEGHRCGGDDGGEHKHSTGLQRQLLTFTEQATDDVSATRLSTSLSFAEVEKEAIINAAQVTGGRIQEMSALLGIGRTTLWRKMKQHGIDAGQFKRRG